MSEIIYPRLQTFFMFLLSVIVCGIGPSTSIFNFFNQMMGVRVHLCWVRRTYIVWKPTSLSYLADATPRIVFFCFILLCHLALTTSNTGFNWFVPCPWGISYMCQVSNGCSYTSNHYVMFKITKTTGKHDDARPGKARLSEAAPRQVGVPWFRKILYLRALWCMQYRDILCAIAV